MKFIDAIFEQGGEVYEVGGSLRDRFLNIEIKDQDLLVRKLPLPKLINLLKKFGHVELVGRSFGVLKFKCKQDQKNYDIALPRTERSTGLGHRDFEVTQDPDLAIEEDLKRRDFTLNAMAKNLQTGEILDPFEGKKDLENKILRQVFEQSFVEDPLRMLRAVQFATRFSLHIEEKTFQSIIKNAPLLETISAERIVEELKKLFLSKRPGLGFELFLKTGLLPYLFPHLLTSPFIASWPRLIKRLDILEKNFYSLFAILFIFSKDQSDLEAARTWLSKYPLSLIGINHKSFLKLLKLWPQQITDESSNYDIRLFIHHLGRPLIKPWLNLKFSFDEELSLQNKILDILDEAPPLEIKDLALQGRDLLKLGFEPGPKLGTILQGLLQLVLRDPHKNKTEILRKYLREVTGQRPWKGG
ncbi:MAG: CCA tRNA nucleotidyltransferase [Deltaproteobacteria bacterium]|nr:CCA tRNA nucleotidyltransferase [Deltaproteobacteria bacterium]